MLFSSKNDKKMGGSKRLTEAEIKRKLYGEYQTESGGSHASSHEVKMNGTAFESHAVKKQDAALSSNTRASVAASAAFGAGVQPSAARPVFSSSKPAASSKSAGQPWNQTLLASGRAVLGVVAGILWKIGTYLLKALDFILKLLDPRKPKARKLLYSITACVMVAALFIGVFRLNNQRKKAMLGELPVSRTVVPAEMPAASSPLSAPAADENSGVQPSQKEESQEAILQALENSSESANSSAEAVVASVAVGKYVIQVATYAAAEDASRIVEGLKQAGFESFYKKQVRNATGHTFFTVYLGRYTVYTEAQESLAKFRKAAAARPFQDAFIRTLEP